jgi:hypothetical protein
VPLRQVYGYVQRVGGILRRPSSVVTRWQPMRPANFVITSGGSVLGRHSIPYWRDCSDRNPLEYVGFACSLWFPPINFRMAADWVTRHPQPAR